MRMPARMICGLALASTSCTPHPTVAHVDVEAESIEPAVEPSPPRVLDTACGGIEARPQAAWSTDDPRLVELAQAWRSRAEAGMPVALRDATPPVALANHRYAQLRLEHAAQDVVGCYIPDAIERWGPACATAESVWYARAADPTLARPDTVRGWAELLGTLDGATAVFDDARLLATCTTGAPPEVLARAGTLGMSGAGTHVQLAFVERIDAPSLSMLMVVRADMTQRSFTREELWTVDRPAAEVAR